MANAASRSAVPVARVSAASRIRALPFSIKRWPMKHKPARLAVALALEPGIGVGCTHVGRIRAPLAAEVALGVAPAGGGASSAAVSLGQKLFIDAQASISVPSTKKCSSDKSRRTRSPCSTAWRNRAATRRSHFFEYTVASPAPSAPRCAVGRTLPTRSPCSRPKQPARSAGPVWSAPRSACSSRPTVSRRDPNAARSCHRRPQLRSDASRRR